MMTKDELKEIIKGVFENHIEYDSKETGDGDDIDWRELTLFNDDIDNLINTLTNDIFIKIK